MSTRIITSICCTIVAIASMAQTEEPDSIKAKELGEVVVNAQMQKTSPTATTYIPTAKQKNASQNAIDLLRKMAIPQIQINPVNDAVTDNADLDVAIFINYMEASKEEMEGMRMADVKKIEYLEFPDDPRFRGAQRVINIVIREYVYGGYTKLTTDENFLIGFSSRNNIFSKFSFKKMSYDLYVGANNWNNHHIGNSVKGIYNLKETDGGADYILTRTETLDYSHFKQNQYPITLRATYISDKIQIRNTIGYTHLSIPTYNQQGSLAYQPGNDNDYKFDRSNPSRSNSIAYQGSFFVSLPRQFEIDVSPRFIYTHRNDNLSYSTSNNPEVIRNAHENAYNYRIDAYLEKSFARKHTVLFGVNGGDNINRLRYVGTNDYSDSFHNAFIAGLLGYQLTSKAIRLYGDIGLNWSQSDINGVIYTDSYPFIHLNFNYSFNNKNTLSAFLQYANATPGINQKTLSVLQENEYLYLTGNPLLKNSRNLMFSLSYTWMPANTFSLNAYGNFNEFFNRQMIVYEPYINGKAIIQTYRNSGNYINSKIGLSANWKLIGNKLQLYANAKQCFYKSTGIYNRSYNPFSVTAQATYYLDSFYFQAYYQSPDKQMFTASPQLIKSRNFHSITVGWANSSWNIRVMAANLFNKGWSSADIVTESALYTECKENIGTASHSRINVAVAYTFGYGKKVQRGNEVGEQSGANSAIMK